MIDYVDRKIKCPHHNIDKGSVKNWTWNDAHMCFIIVNNLASSQLIHVKEYKSSHQMWTNLVMIHQVQGACKGMNYMNMLFKSMAEKGANIPEHLHMMKEIWLHMNLLQDENFPISDYIFKVILALTLPES